MIPLNYSTRSLLARRASTLATVVGTGLVVWSSCALFGLVDGLRDSLLVSGDPHDLIVLREGSTAETTSGFDSSTAAEIATLPGISRDETGSALCAQEMVFIPVAERSDGGRTNLLVRGVVAASRSLRPGFTIVQGREFIPGRRECVVSRGLARKIKDCSLGSSFKLAGKESFRVVGLFTVVGGPAESELWTDLDDLARAIGRVGTVSCVQLRAATPGDVDAIRKIIVEDQRFRLDAIRETDYLEEYAKSGNLLRLGGTLIAVVMTVGAMFAASNTMHAAVDARRREIGTLRAIGFSRRDILLAILAESIILCTLGGAAGLLATLPLSIMSFSTRNSITYSEMMIRFRVGPGAMTAAVLMTLTMGALGGLSPAIRAVRLAPARAIRET
ncbi:ABC transporter permease [Aquisphaera insulae]|uniref:ABC transporter permease n=1 Tax=Aquisphaera insulae TaxID=2712864 RepID=UPI0013EAC7F9|nr:ABC transporter permease [Aquisphaera insulae]